jgi:hypothetical protein
VKGSFLLASSLLSMLLLLSCKRNDELNRVRAGDFGLVYKGTYRGRLNFLGAGRQYESMVHELRADIERDNMVFDLISKEFHTIPHGVFQFKYAAIDEDRDFLVLRYFARVAEHPLYAGYQMQFVFSCNSRRLREIYTSEVPLE